MTWQSHPDTIQAGDMAILYISPSKRSWAHLDAGGQTATPLGHFEHDKIIGQPWGARVWARGGRRSLHVMRPTPEAWTELLPHRTAIVFHADISFVLSMLRIRPGSRVIEAGTGSGSMSHSLLRAVLPGGHLHTFEFHAERAAAAQREFEAHGFADAVTLQHRDVCCDGFGELTADAVFLDLPTPWEAIPHVVRALDRTRVSRICCYSPNMEQVLRTVETLSAHGFDDIRMFETSARTLQTSTARYRNLPVSDHMLARLGISSETLAFGASSGGATDGDAALFSERMHLQPHSKRRAVLEAHGVEYYSSQFNTETSGHTSYLTFAALYPPIPDPSADPSADPSPGNAA